MNLRPSPRSTVLVLAATLAGALVAGAVAWALVADDVARKAAVWPYGRIGGELSFVGTLGAVGGAIAFFATRRLVRGPALDVHGWTIAFRAPTPESAGYRALVETTIGDLVDGLAAAGFRCGVLACDDAGAPRGEADRRAPLVGSHVLLTERAPGGVRILLAPAVPGERRLGLVEARGRDGGVHEQLALFALRELDRRLGGVSVSPSGSRLDGEPATRLTAGLPERFAG